PSTSEEPDARAVRARQVPSVAGSTQLKWEFHVRLTLGISSSLLKTIVFLKVWIAGSNPLALTIFSRRSWSRIPPTNCRRNGILLPIQARNSFSVRRRSAASARSFPGSPEMGSLCRERHHDAWKVGTAYENRQGCLAETLWRDRCRDPDPAPGRHPVRDPGRSLTFRKRECRRD